MYINLNAEALGISGMQSEMIELALTYKFRGMDVDVAKFGKQAQLRGMEHARRLLDSAKLHISGFELPVRWQGDEATYKEDLGQLEGLAKSVAEIGASGCHTVVQPACDDRPYHENFEFHRERFSEIADILAPHGIRLGLGFLAPAHHRQGHEYQFISTPDALLTLMKTIVVPNIGVVVDLWHWHVGGGSVEQLRELSPEQVVNVRVADVPADAALEEITEQDRLPPGETGVVPAAAAFSVLSDIGYQGPVTPFPHASKLAGRTRDRIVQHAAEALLKIVRDIGGEPATEVAAVGTDAAE
jgi:sugar phosphate isomerase/epimerase